MVNSQNEAITSDVYAPAYGYLHTYSNEHKANKTGRHGYGHVYSLARTQGQHKSDAALRAKVQPEAEIALWPPYCSIGPHGRTANASTRGRFVDAQGCGGRTPPK